MHTNIQILYSSLPFLYVQVDLNNSQIETDLHTKPSDKHQYLLKTFCHPPTQSAPSLSASPYASVHASAPLTISSISAAMN